MIKDYTDAGFDKLMNKVSADKDSLAITRDELVSSDKQNFNIADVRNFRVFLKGSVTFKTSDTEIEVVHNLGYAPAYLAFVEVQDRYYPVPLVQQSTSDNPSVIAYSSKTKIRFERSFTTITTKVYYFIFREKA